MQRIQAPWWQPRVARRNRLLGDARLRLGDADHTTAWDDGSQLTLHSAVELATAALQGTALQGTQSC
jgi:hypothetical protein